MAKTYPRHYLQSSAEVGGNSWYGVRGLKQDWDDVRGGIWVVVFGIGVLAIVRVFAWVSCKQTTQTQKDL